MHGSRLAAWAAIALSVLKKHPGVRLSCCMRPRIGEFVPNRPGNVRGFFFWREPTY